MRVCMCVSACIRAYVYVCECECMRVCMCVSACIRAYVCVCEYECVCVCVCVCVPVCGRYAAES